MKSCGLIHLTTRVGEPRARVQFLLLQNLAVDCHSGRPFPTYCNGYSIWASKKCFLSHICFVAIICQRFLAKARTSLDLELEKRF